ncbi:DUF2442 domain-containing protein [Psychromarinibacter sp. C21-152]|uniref:DUF2442 domain-containing protein n=1 Tax=Psychromarinibacter sediminicola TaxID=3033385 RepID=A0AAE3NUA9_9RHOB|nr:DUF2442 domain-containing protein [Psychromarinibacter sediminicola]MDF0601799.1 DUF2442 domain-containing protein [Psychromarinibacter sediminicola]
MSTSATEVRFDDDTMWLSLEDGRTLGVPLAWFPRLLNATPAEREAVTLSPFGLHWEALDEDLSVEALLAGERPDTRAA